MKPGGKPYDTGKVITYLWGTSLPQFGLEIWVHADPGAQNFNAQGGHNLDFRCNPNPREFGQLPNNIALETTQPVRYPICQKLHIYDHLNSERIFSYFL